jgi:hypothetical protein
MKETTLRKPLRYVHCFNVQPDDTLRQLEAVHTHDHDPGGWHNWEHGHRKGTA